ncbi:DUF6113 family protein [Pengzhenrongella phosphoraccumulans]|uniref:DUF6113 family protein n=1 Tax=Pengzhenrongella phosphoraccumulans TaxID=3114394 RepID=UPI00388E8CBC
MRRLTRWFGALLLGGLVGAAGTALHRAFTPWGVVGCLVLVLVAAVLARAWVKMPGLASFGIGWVAVVQVLSLTGPGGDVLIPAGQAIGYVWIVGGMLMIAVAAFAPRRWFAEAPAVTTGPFEPQGESEHRSPATIDSDA